MEKIKRFCRLLFVFSLLTILLTGCGLMNKNFDAKRADTKDIRPVVLKKLEEKYGVPFECVENSSKEDLERYPLKTVYVGEYAPKKNEKNKIVVWISNMDEMKDDYSQYFVKKEATSNIQNLLSGVP